MFGLTFLILSGWVSAQTGDEIKIKGSFDDIPLDLVLLHLEINYQLSFEFEEEEIENVRISSSFGRKPLSEAMQFLLNGTALTFSIDPPKTVHLFPTSEEPIQELEPLSDASRFDVTVSGTIKDKRTGETLPYSNVLLPGSQKGTTANVDGYFTLIGVPSDTSTLVFRYLGYQPLTFQLRPEMDLQQLVIYLEDFNVQLEEVLVLAEKEEQLMTASSGISKIRVSPAQLASLPSFGEKDIFRSLQLLPGVSGTNESSSGLYVRGGTPDQNLILFDGFTVYHVDHLFGFFSAFNPNAVKDVQLYKGGFDARFGGRLSSVVELTGKDGNAEQFNVGLGASLLSVNGFLESPFAGGKGTALVAARRSFQSSFYNNLYQSFTDNNPNATETQGPGGGFGGRFGQQAEPSSHFYDVNAKLTYRPGSKDVFSLSFFNGQDDLDNSRDLNSNAFRGFRPGGDNANVSFESINTDLTEWGNWGSSAKWSRKWSDRFYSNAHLSFSNYYSERDRRNLTTINRDDTTITRGGGTYEFNDLRDYTLKLENELKLSQDNQLEFGLEGAYYDIRYDFTQNDTIDILHRDDQGLSMSAYVQDQHVLFDKLMLKGGLRTTYFQPTNQVYLEPRASLSYQVSNRIRLKAAWGQYYQFANRIVREDIQQGSRDFWVLANGDNIPVGYAEHFIAGASFETPDILIDVEAYFKNLDGLSEYTTRFVTNGFGPNRSLDYEELFYQGTGVARGIEFLLQKKVGKFTGWLGYTLGEVLYDFDAFGEEPFHANQDQTHELKLVTNYKWKNWDFAATFVYATGRPYTAPTGFYEVPLLDGTTAAFFEVSDKNALRLPNYHRADLSATYNFRLGTSKANAGLSLFNLYNRQNVWYKEYEVIEGQLIETDVSLLNFTPSLFFTWTLR